MPKMTPEQKEHADKRIELIRNDWHLVVEYMADQLDMTHEEVRQYLLILDMHAFAANSHRQAEAQAQWLAMQVGERETREKAVSLMEKHLAHMEREADEDGWWKGDGG